MIPLSTNLVFTPTELTKPNAMVFQVVRKGFNYFFDGEIVVFLGATQPPSITDMGGIPEPGIVLNIFREKEQLQKVLADIEHDSFVINPSETVRVVVRFSI